jgi:hypothetical protein
MSQKINATGKRCMAHHHDFSRRAADLLNFAWMAALIAGCASTDSSSSPGTPSGSYHIGSMASEFLQSKTQMHILDDDDKAAPGCQQKRFVKVEVTRLPTINTVGLEGVAERKWTEQWTLDRCGSAVPYDVFFTEVGDGGAYFSVVRP